MSDTRTTTRWAEGELAWLEARAAASGSKVGSVVRAVVRAAMEADTNPVLHRGPAALDTAGAVGRVRDGAAPVSPSGAAPARSRLVRLEVVVARLLSPGGGPIPPVALAAARRRIAAGGVDVSGRGAHELAPDLLVGAGEVVLT